MSIEDEPTHPATPFPLEEPAAKRGEVALDNDALALRLARREGALLRAASPPPRAPDPTLRISVWRGDPHSVRPRSWPRWS